jgi:asparagine synthase (glutamine-hydrolysing)
MCGINGLFAYKGAPVDLDELRRTRDAMFKRGPDGHGEWASEDRLVAFGHRRLAIVDLTEGGAQPMPSVDGQIVVTYNGEIYNFPELRADLEARGCVFRSRADTEVLLHLYRLHGDEMLPMLRGMFAFGLWDAEKRRLLLARDPYGIKPLYYADDGACVRFASSVKALVGSGAISRAPDAAGMAGFYLFGSVPEPWTCYKAIRGVPAGASLVVDADGLQTPRRYFSLSQLYFDAERQTPAADAEAYFRQSALESVRSHLMSDVPVGAFLSAGVDSGALLGLMRDAGQKTIKAVTLAFEAFRGTARDESPLAAEVARRYGAEHTVRWVGEGEFRGDLLKIFSTMDQPSIDGINTWFVAKATRELGLKVAISGVGGDELLGGYSTFARLPKIVRALSLLRRLPGREALGQAGLALARLAGLPAHPKSAGLLALGLTFPGAYLLQRGVFLPSELSDAMSDPNFAHAGLEELRPVAGIASALSPSPKRDFGKVAVLESMFYLRNQLLRDADWAGLAHSLEIRTPLVDSVLVSQVAPLFAGAAPPNGKSLLAKAPTNPLPDGIVNRAKTGFGIPLRQWLDGGEQVEDRLWSRHWLQRVAKPYMPLGRFPAGGVQRKPATA